MRLVEMKIEVDDGTVLFVRDYRPNVQTLSNSDRFRTMVWIHGLGEHGGRYLHLTDVFVGRDWRLILIDLRGHGRSTGLRTHVRSFDEYVTDLAQVWDQLNLNSERVVLGAHSMGGLIALRAVQTDRIRPSAIVLSSVLLGVKLRISPFKRILGRLLVKLVPTVRFRNGLDPCNMTRDAEFSRQRRADPLIVRTVTASWFFSMETAIAQARRDVHQISIPILALRGGADVTTDGDVVAHWLMQTASEVTDLISLPDHVHGLLHESDWKDTTNRVLTWLESTAPSLF